MRGRRSSPAVRRRRDASGRLQFDTMSAYAAPLFHTGDECYVWLNRIQAVSKGTFQPDGTLIYEIFELS